MVDMKSIFLPIALSLCLFPLSSHAEEWSCPNAEQGRELFLDGRMAEWPNYSESHGARVQRQHPNTAFIAAQAKFIDWNGRTMGICQYYSHIGLVATSLVMDAKRLNESPICEASTCPSGAYWRYEFTESSPDLDKVGKEQMLVCMEDQDGLALPSAACGFKMKD